MVGLEFKQFTCLRGGNALFEPLSFKVGAGELVQIAGPNGAGKTTFLRSICGLFGEWEGAMAWDGEIVSAPSYDMKLKLLYLGHHPGVQKSLTARENLEWFFGVKGLPFPGQIEEALGRVGLRGYEDVSCHEMSAGQLRRVALARLYVSGAALWVLDEPFTAIDKQGVTQLEQRLSEHCKVGGSVILTTHQPLKSGNVRLVELQAAGSKS